MKYFSYLTLIFFLIFISCSGNDKQEEAVTEEQDVAETVSEGTEDSEAGSPSDDADYDRRGSRDSDTNQTPTIKKIAVKSVSPNLRDGFVVSITAEDPEGGEIDYIYQWRHNDEDIVGATEETLGWAEEFKKGDKITIEVIPFDEFAQGIWRSEGSFIIPNSPPAITSQPSGAVSNGTFTYKVEASDPDEDTLSFSLKDAPEGMKISDSGEITWTYGSDQAGDYNIVIVVSDGDGGETYQELTLNVQSQS